MTIERAKPSTRQPTANKVALFSSLGRLHNKWKWLLLIFAFNRKYFFPNGRVNKIVASVEGLNGGQKPGAMDGVLPFLMNSNYSQLWLLSSIVEFVLIASAGLRCFF